MKNKFEHILGNIFTYSITTSFLMFFLYIIKISLKNDSQTAPFINNFSILLIIISGIIYLLVFNIFNKEKTKIAAVIIFLFFYIIFEVIICYIFKQYNVPYFIILFSVIQYIFVYVLYNTFRYHNMFINSMEDKTGHELETFLYHNNLLSQDLSHKINKAIIIITVFSAIYFVSLLIYNLNHKLNLFIGIITVFFSFNVFGYLMLILYFGRESYYANIGFREIIKNKHAYIKNIILIFVAANIFGAVLSVSKPIIKITFKEPEAIENTNKKQPVFEEHQFINDIELKNNLEEMLGKSEPSPILDLIFAILKYVFIAALIIGLIYFLFRPFFTKEWKIFWKENRLLQFLKDVYKDLIDFIKSIFNFQKDEPYGKVDSKEFRETINNFMKRSKKSREKKNEIDRITKVFMSLIKWGEKQNILYTKNLAPAEYTKMIITFLEKHNPDEKLLVSAEKSGFLFEKALYDKELLSKEEEKEYNEAIEKIIAVKKDTID